MICFEGYTFYRYGDDYGTDPRGFLGRNNDTKSCMFIVMIPASLVNSNIIFMAQIQIEWVHSMKNNSIIIRFRIFVLYIHYILINVFFWILQT